MIGLRYPTDFQLKSAASQSFYLFVFFLQFFHSNLCSLWRTTLQPNTIWLTNQSPQWVASHITERWTTISSWSKVAALVHANASSLCVNHWSCTPSGRHWNKSNWNSSIPLRRWAMVVSKHQPTNWHSWVHSRRIASAKSKLKPLLSPQKQLKLQTVYNLFTLYLLKQFIAF